MKKIGILTINDYNNYGNRLQNLAVQEVLRSLGCTAETVVNNTPYNFRNVEEKTLLRRLGALGKMAPKEVILKVNRYIARKKFGKYTAERIAAFRGFTNSYITETEFKISEGHVPSTLADQYDSFVTGSDQVWNPIYRQGSSIDFIAFAPSSKRVAYAPSFGVSEIPSEYNEMYKRWLSEMGRLSVREEAGATLIKKLTGKDAVVLVDPTLMLTREKWLRFSKEAANKPKGKYLLTYFLGKQSAETLSAIQAIAKEHELKIISLADTADLGTYVTGPSEFIDYIRSSTAFFTDSFHGAVFSILFEKSFTVFGRAGMNSRMETLLSTFKLASRKWEDVSATGELFHIDYSHVPDILEAERNKALHYLREALSIKE
ncbi:polysaccharide pyruvyl transferase family protein [Paenibacillus methanolicus]|uniref:Polysaccharide pyruvyl transferase n=1 Tax=Paenibacillus methanolicus TaxID=582686 RepID=A0A5S5BPL9_9BACL|nr:polysaccharide pyruvyl transferase family protein [Paenibacillus methanolicus]TYP69131.1 polysaccharide pyruvyl transferase [Paenibacillus methanolicus]